MSTVAKFLVVTIGGGLLLGTIGGHLANPVMLQRGDEPWRQPTIGGGESPAVAEAQPQDLLPYGGRYSHAPAFADEPMEPWPERYANPEWREYAADWPEPPAVVELDARWAEQDAPDARVYGRTVEFPQPSPVDSAAEAEEAAAEPDALPQEPRVARGQLPAIW